MADDYIELEVSPEQLAQLNKSGAKYESTGGNSSASAPVSQPEVHDFLPPKPPEQGFDIGPMLGGTVQGLGHALSGHVYAPEVPSQQQGAYNASSWLGDLGADIGVGLGGVAGGAAAGGALGTVVPGVGNVVGAAVGAPIGAGLALYGKHFLSKTQDEIHENPGQPVNWGAVNADASINGLMGAVAPGEGSIIKKMLLDAAIGGAGGGALNASDQYFKNNGHVDAGQVAQATGGGALGGALLPLGFKGLGKVGSKLGEMLGQNHEPIGMGGVEAAGQTEGQPTGKFKKGPDGKLMPLDVPTTGQTLHGSANYTEERPAPWDSEDIENAKNHDNNDNNGGDGGDPVFSPETGQSVQQPTVQHADVANENMEAVGPSAQQDMGAMSAVDQLRARQQQLAQVANENHEAQTPSAQQDMGAMNAVDQFKARQQQLQSNNAQVANENHEAFGPSAPQEAGAMDAIAQLKTRQQQMAQQQVEQAIEAKANELHRTLTNYERIGSKPQANKLKAEIAQHAASHPDPVERAAYQRALEKYAPEQAKPEATPAPVVQPQPKEGSVKVNLPKKPVEATNEPQGKIQQPKGQQPPQGKEKSAPVAEQKPAEQTGQEKVKPADKKTKAKAEKTPSETQKYKKRLEQARKAINLLQGHADFGETPAHTVLKSFGIEPNDAPNTGHVKNYRVFIPGQGEKTFQWNAPISSVNLHDLAGSIIKHEGGFQNLMDEVHKLDFHSDANTNPAVESTELLEDIGNDQLKEHEDAENKLYESFDQHLSDLKKADTFEELERISDALDSPSYQHIYHGEVREEVENEVKRAIDRIAGPPTGEERPAPHGVDESHPADDRGSEGEAKPTPKRIVNKDVPEVSFEQYLKSKGLKPLSDFEQADLIGGQAEMSARPVSGARKGKIDALAKRQAVIDEAHAEYQGKLKSGEIKSHAVTEEHDLNPDSPADQAYVRAMQRRKEKLDEYNKTTEVDQEALDAISKPADTEKDSLLAKKKPQGEGPLTSSQTAQGTDQREHFQDEQPHKAGKFLLPHEIEQTEPFKNAYENLTPEERDKLHGVADAIANSKKVLTGFYNPGTETLSGVLTKRAGHGQELYTPKGLSVTKKGDILVHGYNENGELSSRRLDRFKGEVTKTTEAGYEGLYKHPTHLTEGETFHPADAILEQTVNPILKKQVQGKPITEADHRQAYNTLRTTIKEAMAANPEAMTQESIDGILEKLPDPVKEYIRKDPCK